MSASNSTPSAKPNKPAKPSADFPLFPHASGQWAKKIRGQLVYFGKWDDPDGALQKYLDEKDSLHSGRTPRPDTRELTVKDLCNDYLNFKKALLDNGELSVTTWTDYMRVTRLLVEQFGARRLVADLRPSDFAALRNRMTKTWGPVRVGNVIQYVRSIFKYGLDNALLDRPVCFGQGFARPTKKVLRLHRAKQGPRLFTPEEILLLLGTDRPQLRAMILLGINAGLGNTDVGRLPITALDLEGGWLNYPRPKTGINRRCPLWPETVEALKEALAVRPEPKDPADAALVFITHRGHSWAKNPVTSPLSREIVNLLDWYGINGRKGLGFYTLRHNFATVGGESRDQVAVDYIMGHADHSMADAYRERISDGRLRAVVEYVRTWLYGTDPGGEGIDPQDGPQDAAPLPRLRIAQ